MTNYTDFQNAYPKLTKAELTDEQQHQYANEVNISLRLQN